MSRKLVKVALAALAACAGLAISIGNAQEGPGTKFRGVYVNMLRAELGQFRSEQFDIKFDVTLNMFGMEGVRTNTGLERTVTIFKPKGKDEICAEIKFDERASIKEMRFSKCYFGAANLNFAQFTKSIVSNYHIANVSCGVETIQLGTKNGIPDVMSSSKCTGFAPTGENVVINEGVTIVSRTDKSSRPHFN